MLKPGHRIGQYEITSVLGDGGMAIVYKARHVGMGTDHAVKVLLPNLAMNPKTVERFRQEARAQFRLRHPNIVQVTDYVETDEEIALVMDLVQGMTLRAAMDQRPGPWSVADVVAVMRPVLDAVAYAHREGLDGAAVVHRDLKPENILLDLAQGRAWPGIPKVADFGIAKVMGTANVATRTNARLGTVPYMSPEQFRSSKDVDARADVWALGMMLWHLVAGRLPLDPDDNVQLLQLYQGLVKVPDLTEVVDGMPLGLSSIVAQAMSIEVAGRFADAWPLLRAVEGAAVSHDGELPTLAHKFSISDIQASAGVHRESLAEPDKKITQTLAAPHDAASDRQVFKTATVAAERQPETAVTMSKRPSRHYWSWLIVLGVVVSVSAFAVGRVLSKDPALRSESSDPAANPADSVLEQPVLAAIGAPATTPGLYRIDAAAGTVVDTRTGLTWQRTTDGKEYGWQQAKEYCAAMVLPVGGWRLPSKDELELLVEMGKRPTIDQIAFPDTAADWFWTSTPLSGSSSGAWGVVFNFGTSHSADITIAKHVRCVRSAAHELVEKADVKSAPSTTVAGGATPPPAADPPPVAPPPLAQQPSAVEPAPTSSGPYRIDAAAGTVVDTRSGLTWQRTTDGKEYSFKIAKDYCGALVLAGGSWRLPRKEELENIIEHGKTPALDGTAFPGFTGGWFWTSLQSRNSSAWIIRLEGGGNYFNDKSEHGRALCVRSVGLAKSVTIDGRASPSIAKKKSTSAPSGGMHVLD